MHTVPARAHPAVRRDLDIEMRDAFRRYETTPRDATGETRLLGTEEERACAAVNTVSADDDLGAGPRAAGEMCDDLLTGLLDVDQSVRGMCALSRQCRREQCCEVAAPGDPVCTFNAAKCSSMQGDARPAYVNACLTFLGAARGARANPPAECR